MSETNGSAPMSALEEEQTLSMPTFPGSGEDDQRKRPLVPGKTGRTIQVNQETSGERTHRIALNNKLRFQAGFPGER
jgi:hypothetical protein